MKAKLKMSIIISVMCLLALCSIVAIIAIFAANTQTFNSNVSVSFKAPGVLGKVSANYYVGEQDTAGTPMTTTGAASGNKELVFNDSPESVNGTLNPQGIIELTSTNKFVVFEYIFQNGLGDSVSSDYSALLTFTSTSAENVKIKTKQSAKRVTDFSKIVVELDLSLSGANQGWFVLEHNEEDSLISTKYFYVKVEIENLGIDAAFSGNFNWELNLAEPSLDALEFDLRDDNTYEVSYIRPKTDISALEYVIIPKTYKGDDGVERPVTTIGAYGFRKYPGSGSIFIPNSIKIIEGAAFHYCEEIKGEIILPESLTTISKDAFSRLEIQCIELPESVTEIMQDSFQDCSKLKYVTINSKTICDNLISWENEKGIGSVILGKTYLIDSAITIKAKYEIAGIEDYSRNFTRSENQDSEGYWTYTYTE